MTLSTNKSNEFSRLVSPERLLGGRLDLEVVATPAECRALAERFGVVAIEALTAHLRLRRAGKAGLIRLAGRFSARVVQSCVVTLQAVVATVSEEVSASYGGAALSEGVEVEIDPEDEDPPEPIPAQGIDVGEVVAQQLALALPAYPRCEKADWDQELWQDEVSKSVQNPFAALKALT